MQSTEGRRCERAEPIQTVQTCGSTESTPRGGRKRFAHVYDPQKHLMMF